MLIIPSRSRPHNLHRLIQACLETGALTPAWVRLDEDDDSLPEYAALQVPKNWEIVVGQHVPLSEVYNEAYREIPETTHWVFIADDVVPITPMWDRILIDVAGDDGMAVPSGGETTGGCPHFILGGGLVSSIGWLALPGLNRLYIDTAWSDIAKQRGVFRRAPHVVLEHRHFSNGKALMDKTYRKEKKAEDKLVYENFKRSIHAYLS